MHDADREPELPGDYPTEARFAPTQWSVVLSARRPDSHEAQQALERLCRLYWAPLYAFARRQGESPHDAQDLTQGFFEQFIERNYLLSVDPQKGRFRSFLLASFKHFLSNERDKARAQKRGGGRELLPLLPVDCEHQAYIEPADQVTPETLFERRWALAVLEQALTLVRADYARQGKTDLFDRLKETLTEPSGTGYARLAKVLRLSEDAVKMAVHRLRRRYREALAAVVGETVSDRGDIQDELRQVLRTLAD
jgi:RNA polymerase sigma factor (sigma-70 family)